MSDGLLDTPPPAEPAPGKLKLPLRGMPFKLDDLKRATRHAMDAARRTGKAIKWQEARKRGYLWLVMMHFPSPFGIQRSL